MGRIEKIEDRMECISETETRFEMLESRIDTLEGRTLRLETLPDATVDVLSSK